MLTGLVGLCGLTHMDITYKKILIIKPSSLGDIIHALPMLSALRKQYPDSWITWVVKNEFKELLVGNPLLNEVVTLDHGFSGWWSVARVLRKRAFDVAIDLQGLFRSACLTWYSGAPERVGFAAAREGGAWFYTSRVRIPGDDVKPWRLVDVHAVDRNLAVAKHLGADLERPAIDLPLLFEEKEEASRWLRDVGISPEDRVLVIAPGGRLPIKRWPMERFASVAKLLHQNEGMKIIVVGAPSDLDGSASFRATLGDQFINLIGKTRLSQLVTVIDRADLLIANDSAPIHLAVARQTSVLAILGPTNRNATGPYPFGKERVLDHSLPCSPCGKRHCHNPCYMECLTSISVEDVLREARDMLLVT